MTPDQFITKWRASTRTEKSAAQEHFLDLCELLEVPKPGEVDPHGAEYTFEKKVKRIGEGRGYADVWKKSCFAWEYKGKRKNLVQAYAQLKQYADDLENPPLLIVSDMEEIRIHTNFTGTISEQHVLRLPDLNAPENLKLLRWCFTDPDRLLPTATRAGVTAKAASNFAQIAVGLRTQHDPRRVAHFINKLVFCLFAEDIELLPDRIFADVLDEARKRPDDFVPMMSDLFRAMANRNGRFGAAAIPWFNGGLFDDDDVLPVSISQERLLIEAARLDWSAIDPTIFGTLFESGLDDKRRAAMASLFDQPVAKIQEPRLFDRRAPDKGVGIHYTDRDTIMKIIEPVVLQPWRAEWESLKREIRTLNERRLRSKSPKEKNDALLKARELYTEFRRRLGKFRVLDPACGSGNFLALALAALKDFDLAVLKEASALEVPPDDQRVGAEAVLGIEANPYAAELARLTVWITELQWQLRNGFSIKRTPILGKLDGIACKDALISQEGKEVTWPVADVVIGNPPFLGGKLMRKSLKDKYVDALFAAYEGRVPAEADLVTYWFAKAAEYLRAGRLQCAGLVTTNSIRGGANRRVLESITEKGAIFDAWSDEPWVVEGAAVRVSLVCFAATPTAEARLNGQKVDRINPDLTASRSDVTKAKRLSENAGVAFMGDTKGGAFDISGDLARKWLQMPLNPNRHPNADVLKPWMNGMDVTRRPSDKWIIDFGWEMDERAASLYEAPFAHCQQNVKPERDQNRRDLYRLNWWRHVEPRPGMWAKLRGLNRYLVTPTIAKHRVFTWCSNQTCPDHQLIVIAREDDTTFGILHSRFHESWALRLGTSLEDRPRYTPSTTFETFPFPEEFVPNPPPPQVNNPSGVAIADAARKLDELRSAWLNPSDLVRAEPEVVPGFPDRVLPRSAAAAAELKNRTLTRLYNERPAWLANAHQDLDAAVAAAYGWPADISEEDALARLLELNLARAGSAQGGADRMEAEQDDEPGPKATGATGSGGRPGGGRPEAARSKRRRP